MKQLILIISLMLCSISTNAQSIQYTYDSLNRVTKIFYPDSSTITYTYDNAGNRKTAKVHDPCSTKPRPIISASGALLICPGDSVFLTSTAGVKYNWSNGDTTHQTIKVTTGGKYAVIRTDTFQCERLSDSVTVTLKPVPTVIASTDQIVCNGTATTKVVFTGALTGTTYNWRGTDSTIGLAITGTDSIVSFTATDTFIVARVDTIIVTPTKDGCYGIPDTFTITVYPTPKVIDIADTSFCNGAIGCAVTIGGTVPGSVFNWVRTGSSIGTLGATGTGNISFNAANTGVSPLIATIVVTPSIVAAPSAGICIGTRDTFTITANPTPTVTPLTRQNLCSKQYTLPIAISGPVSGTTFRWANSNISIGLPDTGSGTLIPPFKAIDTSFLSNSVAIITISPTANKCVGIPGYDTIIVRPLPDTVLTKGGSTIICPGSSITLSASPVASYLWNDGTSLSYLIKYVAGTYFCRLTGFNGCVDTSESVTVSIFPFPDTSINIVGKMKFCDKDSVVLVAHKSIAYLWSPTGDTTRSLTIKTSGSYRVTITDSNHCVDSSSYFNTTKYAPLIINAGKDLYLIEGDTTIIGGSPVASNGTRPYMYEWSPTGSIDDYTTFNPKAWPKVTTQFIVNVVDSNGCTGSDTSIVYVIPLTVKNIQNNLGLIAYPNPTDNTISISGFKNSGAVYNFELRTSDGQLLQKNKWNVTRLSDIKQLSLSEYATGKYILIVENSGIRVTIKIEKR